MSPRVYTVNIGNLKVSGPAEEILGLSKVFDHAANDLHNDQVMLSERDVDNPEHDRLIGIMKDKQVQLEKASGQLVDAIHEDEHYKRYVSERNQTVRGIVQNLIR